MNYSTEKDIQEINKKLSTVIRQLSTMIELLQVIKGLSDDDQIDGDSDTGSKPE